jgi:hypothetical protein
MRVANVMSLSLGEWAAIVRGWSRAHSDKVDPPSVEEFEAAMAGANGVA